jgi:pimeloyl-ACP methyl ester carboxylesterase
MADRYSRWIDRWETRLATRDSNRVVRPFEWGLDWLGLPENGGSPGERLRQYGREAVAGSEAFFGYERPRDYRLEGSHLTFSSAIETRHPENNTVHAEYFPRAGGRAVVVLPQWNADAAGHLGLCRLLNLFGIAALRMSLAYHDRRKPAEIERADYHVSSNLGRTVHAGRQSVIDTRACLDWLEMQGYEKLGVLGTSLGSCIAFITAVHDERVRAAMLNHVSTWFGDVVWTGISTRHVRQGMEQAITRDELREYWLPISPAAYWERLGRASFRTLLVWARYDTTFLPEFSREVLRSYRESGAPHATLSLPCAHYTSGEFPFKYVDGLALCRFAAKHL